MNIYAVEIAARKLTLIGQDITNEACAIALDVQRRDDVANRVTRCQKLIANAEKLLAVLIAALYVETTTRP